jgi:hypothetical protein
MDKITTATDGLAKKKYKYSIKEKYLCLENQQQDEWTSSRSFLLALLDFF